MAKQSQQGSKAEQSALTSRASDYSAWYNELIDIAGLAEHSAVRGCMVIKPYGYAIWENIQRQLDDRIKATGHQNAYFPLFIPKSFLSKEAKHVEGFAMECAVVTHSRLMKSPDGNDLVPDPESKLQEELVVRPTSETIIGESFARWVKSYRDLPLLINQWANVVRWEMRTRLFLRTMEFLWQEGHTVHADFEDAERETRQMLEVYRDFAENVMAMPVIVGRKTDSERFAGALTTYCIEAMMQDRKALQAGTSHNLGQNFAKAFDIQYLSKEQKLQTAWTTSWGVSTRLIGGVVMTHSDDQGLVLPPALAPYHLVVIPIRCSKPDERAAVEAYLAPILARLRALTFKGRPITVHVDMTDQRPGAKHFEWEKKGVPVRVEVGPRDMEQGKLVYALRVGSTEKTTVGWQEFADSFVGLLERYQAQLLERARAFRDQHIQELADRKAFDAYFTPANEEKPEIHGGFCRAGWCGDPACEAEVKGKLKVTIRCIPLDGPDHQGTCVACGKPSAKGLPKVIWAKSY
jgi:prolyl-tRNA synthetase